MRPTRAELLLLAAIAATLAGARGLLPVVRRLDPQLAVDVAWFPAGSIDHVTRTRRAPSPRGGS